MNVTGIEINPIIATDIMRGRYADFAYHLYQRPEVHIHVSDGRSFVRNGEYLDQALWTILQDEWVQAKTVWGSPVIH